MMANIIYFLLVSLLLHSADARSCRDGWTAYKDELCFRTFSTLVPYDEANAFCLTQGDNSVSLVMIKSEEMQYAVANYTSGILNSLWLGGKYDHTSEQFRWEDGHPLTYTNWQEGHPKNNSDSDACIELRTPDTKLGINSEGKWADVNCEKLNMVLCQSPVQWTFDDAINEIISIRKQLESTKAQLEDTVAKLDTTSTQLETAQQDLKAVASRVVPVGSIYIEYYGQESPSTIWPNLSWQDVSDTYAGLFFRVIGGGSESWGTTQDECFTRISQMEYSESDSVDANVVEIPINGWSSWCWAGVMYRSGEIDFENFRLYSSYCENRPKNQAVRIWKRVA